MSPSPEERALKVPMESSDGETLTWHLTLCTDRDCPMIGKPDHFQFHNDAAWSELSGTTEGAKS